MVYAIAWDEATPVGATTSASDIDLELQNLKISIRERLDDLIGTGNWANDAVDPKELTGQEKYYVGQSLIGVASTVVGAKLGNISTKKIIPTSGAFANNGTDITLNAIGVYDLFAVFKWGTLQNPASASVTLTAAGTAVIASRPCFFTNYALGGLEASLALHAVITTPVVDEAVYFWLKTTNASFGHPQVNDFQFSIRRIK